MSPTKLVVALMVGLLLAPAAEAAGADRSARAGSGSVSVEPARRTVHIDTGSCSTPVSYTVVPGALPDGGSYDVTARLRDAAGRVVGRDRTWIETGSTYRGSIDPSCRRLSSGAHVIDVTVAVNDSSYAVVETRTGSATVRLRVTEPAPTRLVVRKYAYGSRGWQWTGRLTSAGRPLGGQRIDLWWDLPGWEDYEVSKRTDRRGVAHWVSNPNGGLGGIRFQLRFAGAAGYGASRSATFDLAPR